MVLASWRPRTVLGCLGRAGMSGWPWRSYATVVAAAGPGGACRPWWCGWPRVLGGQLSGGWSAGRRRSRRPVAAPGSRAHACRSPPRPHDGRWRGPVIPGAGAGRASAQPPTGRCTPGRPRSRPDPCWLPSGPAGPGTGRRASRRPAPGSGGPARRARAGTVPLASLLPGLSEVQVLDHDRPAAALAGQPDQRGDGRAQPPVALAGGQPRQHDRDRRPAAPAGFPSGVTTHPARCPQFWSTASTG